MLVCRSVRLLVTSIVIVIFLQADLEKPPQDLFIFHEIAVQYKPDVHEAFNALGPEERVLLYYLYRASLPGHYICADQTHRHAVQIIELFETVLEHKEQLKNKADQFTFDINAFLDDVTTYLIYLWTNHSQYFIREKADQKKTPKRIGLKSLDEDNLTTILQAIDYTASIDYLLPSIFDRTVEPTVCVDDNIAASAVNMYHPDFTDADFQALQEDERSQINAYFDVQYKKGKRTPSIELYRIGGKYDKELEVAAYWLKKAHKHVKKYPQLFDGNMIQSLDYLITFLQTGDEEWFKKHSVAWTKTKNDLDWTWGWIEVYDDPKKCRGMFEAEVTKKTIDMQTLNRLLPLLEKRLPFPERFKRQNLEDTTAIPNASINTILFGTGHMGPIKLLAAYCLPNYAELREEHGAKQIIYQSSKGLGKLINPELSMKLFHLPEQVAWLKKNDPHDQLQSDLWDVLVILHETLGHGSGRFDKHVFKPGDTMEIGNLTYAVGDEIQVTSKNETELLGQYYSSLEELRAEIIALYTSIYNFDELAQAGLYKQWPERIGKQRLIEELIKKMAFAGLARLLVQPKDSDEIHGAHPQANATITNYLLDGGGLELVEQEVEVKGKKHTVLGFNVSDVEQVCKNITTLAQEVQRIRSTGDGQAVTALIETYGRWVRNRKHRDALHENRKAVTGDLKVLATLFPHYELIKRNGQDVDVSATWPRDVVHQFQTYKAQTYSKE